jgi:hypothetical protein
MKKRRFKMGSVFSKQELELLLNVIQLRIDYQMDKEWVVGNPLWDMEKKLKDLLFEFEK